VNAVERSSETGVLGSFHVREAAAKPFPYFLVDDVLEREHADSLLAWLESYRWWELVHANFYDQYEFEVCNTERCSDMPEECKPLFTQAVLGELAALVGEHLGTERCLISKVVAHMLKPGQGIGIHDDVKGNGPPTFRFVLQFNRSHDDRDGGHLGLFVGHDLDRVIRIVRPLHNTGCAFAIGPASQHAVSDVRRGNRYTLVYTFTA
jgi:hypothetical protein